jgi:hypothetical protein
MNRGGALVELSGHRVFPVALAREPAPLIGPATARGRTQASLKNVGNYREAF